MSSTNIVQSQDSLGLGDQQQQQQQQQVFDRGVVSSMTDDTEEASGDYTSFEDIIVTKEDQYWDRVLDGLQGNASMSEENVVLTPESIREE